MLIYATPEYSVPHDESSSRVTKFIMISGFELKNNEPGFTTSKFTSQSPPIVPSSSDSHILMPSWIGIMWLLTSLYESGLGTIATSGVRGKLWEWYNFMYSFPVKIWFPVDGSFVPEILRGIVLLHNPPKVLVGPLSQVVKRYSTAFPSKTA